MNTKISKFEELLKQSSYHSGDKVDFILANKNNEYRVQLISLKGEVVNFAFNDLEKPRVRELLRKYESQ